MGIRSLVLAYPEFLLSLASFLFLFLFLQLVRRPTSALPTNWPVVGMLPGLLSQLHRIHEYVAEALPEAGCTFLFHGPWFSGMSMLVTADPANVNHVFNANFANYPKGEEFLETFDVLGDGIFNADYESWKSQRRTALSLISAHEFRRFVAATSREKVEKDLLPLLVRAAEERSVVDLQDIFLRFTIDTTCKHVLGVDPGCLSPGLPVVPLAKAMDDAEEVLFFRHIVPPSWWKLLRYLRVGEEKKMMLAQETIDSFVQNQISKRMEEVSKGREERKEGEEIAPTDLLTSYMEHQPRVSGDFAVEFSKFLRDTAVNLLLAGRDTVASGLSWFLWVTSQNPDVEHKILGELSTILAKRSTPNQQENARGDFGPRPVLFEAEELTQAVYLHAALLESLRLFPPVPFELKSALRPDVLPSGHKVNPNLKIFFSLYAMGRMEGVWGKDCREFKPERWISERGRLKHEPSYRFLSFNSGPRTCIGKDMAFTQMKVAAAAMLYNFRFSVVKGHIVAPKVSIILHMRNGLKVTVENRRYTDKSTST